MLKNDTVVATVMSNLGLNKYAENNDINLIQTKVGDRYVLEEMLKNGYNLGGEQSGHVICLDYNPTGDGILTSVLLIRAILEQNKKASEIANIMRAYPQVLVNAKIQNSKKDLYDKDEEIKVLSLKNLLLSPLIQLFLIATLIYLPFYYLLILLEAEASFYLMFAHYRNIRIL